MSRSPLDQPLRPITEDEIATFERDGVVCLRRVLPESWLTRMHDAVEVALRYSTNLSEMARNLAGGAAAAGAARSGSFVAGIDHWRQQPEFKAFASESPLPAIAAALMRATKVNLYEDSVLVKEPGSIEPTEFHQDLAYFHVEGAQVCTIWCPLDPTTRATGAVGYVRGSHRWQRMFKPNLFVSPMAIPGTEGDDVPDVAADPEKYGIVYFELGPGDVTVHHARTIHGAGPNASTTTRRRAISVRYCGNDARYLLRPGAPRKPHHDRVRNGDVLDCEECPVVWRAS
jgi:ectoine hydroxylase-related dioxygenase (phytanoyl-CoA dioxygenase family)